MIKLENVSFQYENNTQTNSIKNINLVVNKGEVVLLTGESGCGKTTLTRLINGLIPNYYEGKLSGSILVNNLEVNKCPLYDTAKMVGSVFQNPRSQFFNVDTTSELAFGCENMGLSPNEINRRIQNTVFDFNIAKLMDRSIFNLSGGEKQKIACASVSVSMPDVFVFDEPSSNLDVDAIEELRVLIEQLKSQGKTIIIAEHRLYFLKNIVDRIIYMKDGEIAKEFTSKDICNLNNHTMQELGLRPISLNSLPINNKYIEANTEQLSLTNFSFAYKRQSPVLNIESVDVPKSAAIAIIGHNGAGKSTFARCLCGLEKSCKGVLSHNSNGYKTKKRLKKSFMVMQDVNHQLFTESVLDEILLSMDDNNETKADDILKSLDLYHLKDFHPMSLSGGQKQRVAIASAVASQRDIILFDEPTSGLDLRHMKEVAKTLNKLRKLSKTLFIISHDLELISSCCTHVIHLESGKIVDQYPLDTIGQMKLIDFFV